MRDAVKRVEAPRKLELLAPARDAQVARAAILHGADAVYIGPPSFGARAAAGNSLEDIKELCDFAHKYRVKVYCTVNTIVYDRELEQVAAMISDLYKAGVDALIVQDMGILRLDIPPIELHASTQCDTRTPEKARFLESVGFSQIVLARELTLAEIREICSSVSVPVEVFIHGALCVSYSGRCHASQALCGRSANRGECAQICRLPYTLLDAKGRRLNSEAESHLLSLHDFNTSHSLRELVEAGASSFKIEGRLKDASYVKNVTAYYRRKLDEIIAEAPDKYRRSSAGFSQLNFSPNLCKSFNRGFTDYFLNNRQPKDLASTRTPKSLGEPLRSVADVHNGDGISFFNRDGKYTGFLVNGKQGDRLIPNRQLRIPVGVTLYRTGDVEWEKLMRRDDSAQRTVEVDITLYENRITATDERGASVTLRHELPMEPAKSAQDLRKYFAKMGDTIYRLRGFESEIPEDIFIPASALTALRRELLAQLDFAAKATYPRAYRRPECKESKYPAEALDYRDNVANHLAETFYKEHGISKIEAAMEVSSKTAEDGRTVMTTRYCVLRQVGLCMKQAAKEGKAPLNLPLTLRGASRDFILHFDCSRCEMQVKLGASVPATRRVREARRR
ncbi:MAG: U32 family peptidase [Bacteroidales bacterium]|nr:U32 family peptidase [Bacteroidales bacterium]